MTSADSAPMPRLTRIYIRALILTALGSISLFALADQSPSFFIIGVVGSSIGYWYITQGPSSISRLSINALLAIVVVLGLINALRGNFSVDSFAFFSLLLLVLKLFDLRTPRDHGQILVLSLAIMIAAALTSNSMLTGVGVVLMGFVLIRGLMLFRLYALSTSPCSKAVFDPIGSVDLRSMQTIIGFVCSIVAILIFLVMPRSLGSSAFGQWGGAGAVSLTSGFADDVELGRPGRITSSPTPVLRMTVRDRNDRPVGNPNSRAIYLRGSVLTQYDNGHWVAQRDQDIPVTFRTRVIEQNQSVPIVNDNSRAQWTHEYSIIFDRPEQNYGYLFSPWKPLELKSSEFESRVGVDTQTRMILLSNQPINSYRVRTSNPEFETPEFPSGSQRPEIDDDGITIEIASLAQQILARAGVDPDPSSRSMRQDIQAVRALETHLRTQFTYTLDSEPIPAGRDATEWFLFGRQEGHCEYYASALTLMSRSVGVQARVVTGYVAAEYNDLTDSYMVRESNAHAWVEALVAPGFWRTFDGTPQSDFHDIHEPEPSFFRSISKLYETIEHAWVTAVIGYDTDSRSAVFGDMDPNLGLSTFANSLQDRFAAGRVQLFRKALITAGVIFVGTMILGLSLIFLLRMPVLESIRSRLGQLMARATSRSESSRTQLAAKQLTSLIHAKLADVGDPCPTGVPLRMHLDSLDHSQQPEFFGPLDQAVALMYAHEFEKNATHLGFVDRAQSFIRTLKAFR